MELSANQKDALAELINIAYSRAAGALSELTGYRIQLEVPRVDVHPVNEMGDLLKVSVQGEVASVNQVFSGPVSGTALLLLDEKAAMLLTKLLTDDNTGQRGLDSGAREVITEVGNIILNACLGVFGNLLQVQVTFSVPRIHMDSVEGVLNSITVKDQDLKYALMITTRFHVRASNVVGYLVIILGVTSLDRLLLEVRRWEERQAA